MAGQDTATRKTESATPRTLVVPLAGKIFNGSLIAIDEQWNLTFETDAGQEKMIVADLLRLGRCVELHGGPVVVLADGGLLRADSPAYEGERLTVESPLFTNVRLPRKMVGGVVFELPVDRREADRILDWAGHRTGGKENAAGKENSSQAPDDEMQDRIRLLNGDEISGRITALDEKKVRIEPGPAGTVGAAAIDLDIVRVAALRFTRAIRGHSTYSNSKRYSTFYVWAGMSDGSLLAAESVRLADGKLRLRVLGNPPGAENEWTADADDVVFLQPIGPKALYLSNLTAAGYRHVPYLELPWPYENDRSATGGRLRCGGRLFVKGLGVHSSARLTYMLDRPFARFEAAGGIDDSTDASGSVRFRVYLDGQKKHDGQIIRGGDEPENISVDVSGGKRLDLIVDFGDRADQQDHADWLDARLIIVEP